MQELSINQGINGDEVAKVILDADFDSITNLIKQKKLDVNVKFSEKYNSCTIWHLLAIRKERKHIELLQFFLQKYLVNSDILNTPNNNGLSPIHLAANNGNIESINILVQYGANPLLAATKVHKYTALDILSKDIETYKLVPKMKALIEKYQNGEFSQRINQDLERDAVFLKEKLEQTTVVKPKTNSFSLFNGIKSFFTNYINLNKIQANISNDNILDSNNSSACLLKKQQ